MTDKKPADRKIKCQLSRSYWDEGGARLDKGAVVEMTAEDAMDAVEAGWATRLKGAANG